MKNRKITVLVALVILAVVVTILVEGSFAKYASKDSATATAVAATWNFEVGVGSKTVKRIDLATTIPSNTYNIASGVIAPGTSGEFTLLLDASDCQVGVKYSISFEGLDGDSIPSGLSITAKNSGGNEGVIPYSTTKSDMIVEVPMTWKWDIGTVTDGVGSDNVYQGGTFNNIKVIVSGEQNI